MTQSGHWPANCEPENDARTGDVRNLIQINAIVANDRILSQKTLSKTHNNKQEAQYDIRSV